MMPNQPPSTELQNAPIEVVGFDVKISSPLLAYSAVRRIYLRCRRPDPSNWFYKGQRVARNNLPNFDVVRRVAGATMGMTSPSLAGVLK